MSVGTLQQQVKTPTRAAVIVSPPRLRPKGPVGLGFYQRRPAEATRPKQSAVERLEADKAKYVKSQVALSKQQPVRPPETRCSPVVRRPLLDANAPPRPTRKAPTQTKVKQEEVQLDLERLTDLISDVPDGPCAGIKGRASPFKSPAKEKPRPPPRPDWFSPAKVRLKASGPSKVETPVAGGTVRRVDVIPQADPVRTGCRPPQYIRQPLRPLHPQLHPRAFHPRSAPASSPLKPVVAPSKAENPIASAQSETAAPPLALPPPSPAVTRLSSSSSRKRPSLTRSKSDMSDRFSRAGTDLERFFNLCGLDPSDLRELAASSSDVVSLARFRSVSAPGSECGASGRGDGEEEEEDDDAGKAADRVPYGVSVIERNARVIKWLYGLRQAKDGPNKSTNL